MKQTILKAYFLLCYVLNMFESVFPNIFVESHNVFTIKLNKCSSNSLFTFHISRKLTIGLWQNPNVLIEADHLVPFGGLFLNAGC